MSQQHDIKKSYHFTEIIPSEKAKQTFLSQKEERFLIAKREKNKIVFSGLGDYLKNIKKQREFLN